MTPPHGNQTEHGDWVKLPCGCWAEWNGGNWWIAATSFTCDHRQGDNVHGAPPEFAEGR